MEKEISEIFKEIFKLAIYDQDTNAYYLSKIDYEILGLSNSSYIRKKINQKCDELNIDLQYPHKPLPEIQDEYLFEEYNNIRSKLNNNPSTEEYKQLEKRRILLRNKIAQDNLELIKIIINRRIYEIHNNIDKEDIYQFGYEKLINYIDSSYLDKEKMKVEINCELILYIENQILHTKNNISTYKKEQVSKLKNKIKEEPTLTQSELSEKLDLSKGQIKALTNLDNILSSISTDSLEYLDNDGLTKEEIEQNKEYLSLLCNENYEENLIEQLEITEYVNLIVATLPKDKQNILNLYFGLNGHNRYNMPQIAKIYNLTRARISSIIIESLQMIRNSLRVKYLREYLKDIYEIDDSYELEQSDKLNLEYEEKLIRNLPEDIINKIMEKLNKKQRNFFQVYCEDDSYSITELSQKLNISGPHTYQIKKSIIEITRKVLLELIPSIPNDANLTYDVYYQYIKYLTNIYSHQIKMKKRR